MKPRKPGHPQAECPLVDFKPGLNLFDDFKHNDHTWTEWGEWGWCQQTRRQLRFRECKSNYTFDCDSADTYQSRGELRVVQAQAILFLKSMSERGGSDIERL